MRLHTLILIPAMETIDHKECARDKLRDRTATWPKAKVLKLVRWDVELQPIGRWANCVKLSACHKDGLFLLPKINSNFLKGGFCMSRKGGLQGFPWHVEYVPAWKRGETFKSKPKTKAKFEKHEWIDWSQFKKYQNNSVATN